LAKQKRRISTAFSFFKKQTKLKQTDKSHKVRRSLFEKRSKNFTFLKLFPESQYISGLQALEIYGFLFSILASES